MRLEKNLETPMTSRMDRGSGMTPGWERRGTLLPFRNGIPTLGLGVPSGQRLPCKGRDSPRGPQTFHCRTTSHLEALEWGWRPGLQGSMPPQVAPSSGKSIPCWFPTLLPSAELVCIGLALFPDPGKRLKGDPKEP